VKVTAMRISGIAVSVVVTIALTVGAAVLHGQAAFVRWDIINLNTSTTPPTISAGGVAVSKTADNFTIRLTGSGTFVAPAGRGGGSGAATGGGTWEVLSPANQLVASGSYVVRELVDWEFANLQPPVLNDTIGSGAANGNAALRIEYSDGTRGVLIVGCHGPGAPAGITEGVVATKGYLTFFAVQPGSFTVFHILR